MNKSVGNLKIRPRTDTIEIGNRPENKLGDIGKLQFINLRDIEIDSYQKNLNISRVEKIVKNFDINRMRPIELSYRDGKYFCYDGQHRANAYYLMGYTEIPAIIHYGLTKEDEAYLFARQQDEVGSVNSSHKWNALREAKDPEVTEIIKVCKDWGFTVLAKNNRGNNIKCVKTLRDLYREFGPAKFATILMCIKNAWGYMNHSTDVAIIGGIAKLVRLYPEIDYNRLTDKLSNTTPKIILRDMEDKHHGVRGEINRAAYQIVDIYNCNSQKGKNKLNSSLLDPRTAQ